MDQEIDEKPTTADVIANLIQIVGQALIGIENELKPGNSYGIRSKALRYVQLWRSDSAMRARKLKGML